MGERSGDYKGDFALLNPWPRLVDEFGTHHCPLPMVTRTFDEADGGTYEKALCGEELGVIWRYGCPVPDSGDRITHEDASDWAVTSSWTLECAAGHVLLTSNDGSSDDTAQDFDPQHLWPAPSHNAPKETGGRQ